MDTALRHLDRRFPTGVVPLRGAPETKMMRRFLKTLLYTARRCGEVRQLHGKEISSKRLNRIVGTKIDASG
jgi:hypothetical protein